MPQLPVKNIAGKGVIADVDAHSLDVDTISMGVNVRCETGRIERGPVSRLVGPLPQAVRHVFAYDDTGGATQVHIVGADGRAYAFAGAISTDLSPTMTPSTTDAAITSCVLNGAVYLNREDRQPWYRSKDGVGTYETISSYVSGSADAQLPADVRFRALRATAGFLVGINVTIAGQNVPNKVKWSNIAADYGSPPPDWDYASTTSLAGENVLAEMTGSLVDGLARANSMILYGTRETWTMDFVGAPSVFRFARLFDTGIINTNCVVERDGIHYVFGNDDIYMHDGTGQKRSIAQNRVRKFVFGSLVQTQVNRCFAVHNSKLTEIMFAYVSNDQYCAFPYVDGGPIGCNRAAVYNYTSDCWYFYDLPYVTSATIGPVTSGITWNDLGTTWNDLGGSWASQGDTRNAMIMPGSQLGAIAPVMRSFDLPDATATTGRIDVAANGAALVLKTSMSFDSAIRAAYPYRTLYGTNRLMMIEVEGIYPSGAEKVYVSVGTSYNPTTQPVWGPKQTWEAAYPRIDCNDDAAFLSLKIEYSGFSTFHISGYNLEVKSKSRK